MSKVAEYIERKQKATLSQLEKDKWWQQTYDPRPLKPGDVIKTRGRETVQLLITHSMDNNNPENYLRDALAEMGAPGSTLEYLYVLRVQPGFTCRIGEDSNLVFESDVFIEARASLYSAYDKRQARESETELPDTVRVSAELMNKYFPAVSRRHVAKVDHEVLERTDPITEGPTNYEAFAEFLAELDKPGLPDIYPDLVKSFKLKEVTIDEVDDLADYAPYLEWSRKHGGDGIEAFQAYGADLMASLAQYKEEFDDVGIDPETNNIHWSNSQELWSRGDFSVIELQSQADFERQGEFLEQCVKDTEGQPYCAMADAGHWRIFSLLNKTGRPVATICAAPSGHKCLSILENRGSANVALHEDANREGRSGKYAQIIDAWFADWEGEGYTISRRDENQVYSPDHREYGLEAMGYSGDFYGVLVEAGPEHWETTVNSVPDDGRQEIYYIESLDTLIDYVEALSNSPYYFVDSDPEPDYDDKINRYNEASTLELSRSDLTNAIDDIISMPAGERDIDEVVSLITALHVAIQHQDALRLPAVYTKLKDHILEELVDFEKEAIENDEVRYKNDYSQFASVGSQIDLNFVEADTREWSRRVREIAERVFDMDPIPPEEFPGNHGRQGRFDFDQYALAVQKNERELREQAVNRDKPALTDRGMAPSLLGELQEPPEQGALFTTTGIGTEGEVIDHKDWGEGESALDFGR